MIVPNKGDIVRLQRIGKFVLYSEITKVTSFNATAKTWEVDIQNGSGALHYTNDNEPDYHFADIPVTLKDKDYAGNDWEIVG